MSSNEYTLHGRHSTVYRYPTYAEARKAMTPEVLAMSATRNEIRQNVDRLMFKIQQLPLAKFAGAEYNELLAEFQEESRVLREWNTKVSKLIRDNGGGGKVVV